MKSLGLDVHGGKFVLEVLTAQGQVEGIRGQTTDLT